ncbi:methyltransferase domain-containing protein [Pseudomonadota bacterium]
MKPLCRDVCAISGAKDVEHLYTFKEFPVFMGCVEQSPDQDLKADMSWWISPSSGLIQLKQLIPLETLYPESHGAGAIGKLWQQHHQAFARFITDHKPRKVLEIGGAHGILATEFMQLDQVEWTIVEPNPNPIEKCPARFIKGFFDNRFEFDNDLDTVVHSHVLEHIYEPNVFTKHLAEFMRPGMRLVFSVPNMQVMLERCYTNCINFEHTLYLTETYIEHLLSKHGFKIVNKEYFLDDHSIFFAAEPSDSVVPTLLSPELYKKNRDTYLNYTRYHEQLVKELNQQIRATELSVYLFGAHVFAQYLIAFGLDTSNIKRALDNDPNKQGKRLYGTHLSVRSPKILRDVSNPIVILKAGVYNAEIKEDIVSNINASTTFLE